jgi:hypothetical protein
MSLDNWMTLWMATLWGGAIAFFVVTVYIVVGWLRRLYIKVMDDIDPHDDGR